MTVVRRRGSAAELHALDPFELHPGAEPWLLLCELTRPGVVLGSRQNPSMLDRVACEAGGFDIARRRSGGGIVVLRPDDVIWIDVIVPGPAAVPDDVRGSMVWAGERWAAALGTGTVHRGGMVATPWSELMCFAGIGPGEVLDGDRKLVGLSQRRTRHGARIQGLVHRRVPPDSDVELIASPHPSGRPPSAATVGSQVTADDLVIGIEQALVGPAMGDPA